MFIYYLQVPFITKRGQTSKTDPTEGNNIEIEFNNTALFVLPYF